MFDFDIGKLIVFGIVALAVIPPKELPRVLRTVGKYVGQMRRMAAEFRGQFDAAIKEVEFESIKKEIEEINDSAKVDTSFDPAALMRDNIEKAAADKPAPPAYETATDEPSAPPAYEAVTVEPPAPADYETVTVEPPAPAPEPMAVEAPSAPQKAASSAT